MEWIVGVNTLQLFGLCVLIQLMRLLFLMFTSDIFFFVQALGVGLPLLQTHSTHKQVSSERNRGEGLR